MKKFIILSLFIILFTPFISLAKPSCKEQTQNLNKEFIKKYKSRYKVSDEYKFFCRDNMTIQIVEFGKNNKYLLVLCNYLHGKNFIDIPEPILDDEGNPECFSDNAATLSVWKKSKKGIYENIVDSKELWRYHYNGLVYENNIVTKGSYFTVEYESDPGGKEQYFTFKEVGDDILLYKISSVEINYDTEEEEILVDYQYGKDDSEISIIYMPNPNEISRIYNY